MAKRPFTGQIIEAQGLDDKGMRLRMRRLGGITLGLWKARASDVLNHSAADYIGGLRVTKTGPKGFTCSLRPKASLPFMVELGLGQGGIGTYTGSEYDLTKVLLRSGKAKTSSKGNKYLYVPFKRTKAQVRRFGGVGAMSVLQSQPRIIGGRTRGPGFSRSPFASHKIKQGRGAEKGHKSTALGGMYPVESPYKTHGGKSTVVGKLFRTASEAGQPWMTKGIKPRYIAEYLVKDYKVGDLLAGMF